MPTIEFDLRKVPRTTNSDTVQYFPVVATPSECSEKDLYAALEKSCTVTSADIKAVLDALAHLLRNRLASGQRVTVPELGSFSVSLGNDAPITDPNDKQIARSVRVKGIVYRPKQVLLRGLQDVTFHRSTRHRHVQALSEAELVQRLQTYFADETHAILTRADFQTLTGYSCSGALRALGTLVEKGVLTRHGRKNSPYYMWVKTAK